MILYCIAIWDELNTVYVAEHGLSPNLNEAILFKDTKGVIHPIMNYLPVFVTDDLIPEDEE